MLYYGIGLGDTDQFTLRRLSNQSGTRVIEDVSVPDDGLPRDALGQSPSCSLWATKLFVAVGGHTTGQHARVLALLSDATWHVIYRHPTANQRIDQLLISERDDGVPRLHMIIEGADFNRLSGPSETHPESGISIDREDEGFIVLPEMDAGPALVR